MACRAFSLLAILWPLLAGAQAFTPLRPFVTSGPHTGWQCTVTGTSNITDNLVLWFNYDPAWITGTTLTNVVYTNGPNGTINGSPTDTNSYCHGFYFPTSSDYVNAGNLNFDTNWTFITWFNLATNTDRPMIFAAKDTIGDRSYVFGAITNATASNNFKLYIEVNGNSYSSHDGGDTNLIGGGEWHLMAYIFRPYTLDTNNRITADMVLDDRGIIYTIPNQLHINQGTTPLLIGKRAYSGYNDPLMGSLSDTRIYTNMLTTNEINQLYHTYYGHP